MSDVVFKLECSLCRIRQSRTGGAAKCPRCEHHTFCAGHHLCQICGEPPNEGDHWPIILRERSSRYFRIYDEEGDIVGALSRRALRGQHDQHEWLIRIGRRGPWGSFGAKHLWEATAIWAFYYFRDLEAAEAYVNFMTRLRWAAAANIGSVEEGFGAAPTD